MATATWTEAVNNWRDEQTAPAAPKADPAKKARAAKKVAAAKKRA